MVCGKVNIYGMWNMLIYMVCGKWYCIWYVENGKIYGMWKMVVYMVCGKW